MRDAATAPLLHTVGDEGAHRDPSRGEASSAEASRLRLDPTACRGVALCAHLAPDLVQLDSWGYPIVDDVQLSAAERARARAAVRACPRRALYLG